MIYVFEKKSIRILIIMTIIVISSFSVGYAYLSQSLGITGTVTVLPGTSGTVISSISSGSFVNSASESTSSSYTDNSATFGITLPKVNSSATYNITIKNSSSTSSRYTGIDSTISNNAFTYTISGIDTSTILASGESVTFSITFNYTSDYKYTLPDSTSSNYTFTFNFSSTTREALKSLTASFNTTTGNVSDTDNGALFTITVNNPNAFPVSYTLEGENGFVVYDKDGNVSNYYLDSNSSDTYDIYINDSSTSIASGTSATVNIIAKVADYDEKVSNTLGTLTLTLKEKNKYVVIAGGGGIKVTPDSIDYSASDSSSSGIYAAKDGDGYTYYYRGVVSNNYFSFAGYTWRILRIDKNSNVRLILNDYIKDGSTVVTKAFKSSYSATSLEAANTLLRFVNDKNDSSVNSPIYGSISSTDSTDLRGWYNTNLVNYEDYIVDSEFCFDMSGGYGTSSGTSSSVYYYGSYQRIGGDTQLYSPDFTCDASDLFTEKIGLLSSDEYVFAGGAFRQSNSTMFLVDFGNSTMWWTLSPAYYDANQSKVGALAVLTTGAITDWINNSTVTNTGGIRPVISVDGNKEITGSGTSSSPYVFKDLAS